MTTTTTNEQKQCYFCTSNIKVVNYKDSDLLRRFLDAQAKVLSRRKTNLCAHHQRQLAQAVKRARFLALIPYIEQ